MLIFHIIYWIENLPVHLIEENTNFERWNMQIILIAHIESKTYPSISNQEKSLLDNILFLVDSWCNRKIAKKPVIPYLNWKITLC